MMSNFFFRLLMNHKNNIEMEDKIKDLERLKKLKHKMKNDEKMKDFSKKFKKKKSKD